MGIIGDIKTLILLLSPIDIIVIYSSNNIERNSKEQTVNIEESNDER